MHYEKKLAVSKTEVHSIALVQVCKSFLKKFVSKCLKNEVPVYLKNKIQYLSDRYPYSLQNVVSEKLQIPKAKT
jgi:hypothetical protein